jgi:carbon-monoxide dehydrogenase medium subunit
VKPAPFTYHRPGTLDEAVEMLAATDGKVLAGGQSLVPIMSMRLASPPALIDINHIPGQDRIILGENGVTIGCLTRHRSLELDPAAYAANPLLRRALQSVAHPTIRNRGTTLGSLVHADPAAEMPAVLCLLGGSVEALSAARGRRTIGADEFFVGPLESALEPDEIAVRATFPHPAVGSGTAWLELARRHGDYAMAGVGALVVRDGDGAVSGAKVALISVGVTPIVVDVSGPVRSGDDAGIADLIDAAIDPEGDIHATAEYRRQLVRTLSARALHSAERDASARMAA